MQNINAFFNNFILFTYAYTHTHTHTHTHTTLLSLQILCFLLAKTTARHLFLITMTIPFIFPHYKLPNNNLTFVFPFILTVKTSFLFPLILLPTLPTVWDASMAITVKF